MATQNNLHISDELLVELQAKAAAEGKSVGELASEALRTGLEYPAWRDLVAYGWEHGRAIGFTEEQAGEIVREWRNEQRR
jgi:plasmid stability protein